MSDQDARQIIGRQVGNFEIVELLGSGGMGAVYRMRHQRLPAQKAIKVLNSSVSLDIQQRFQQEAYAASAVDHDAIVKVEDAGTWPDGMAYLIMELVDGRSLDAELKEKGFLPLEVALKMLLRLADALALVHAKGIVHRDLKPPNILLPKGAYRPKICDFGIASAEGTIKHAHTLQRVICGTPGYQSPEQAAAMDTDGRTDIFSLAAIGYQMITGQLPHPPIVDYSPFAVAEFLVRPVPTLTSKRPPDAPPFPPIIEEVFAKALAMDVGRRYTTMVEFRNALVRCLNQLGISPDGTSRNMLSTEIKFDAGEDLPAPPLRTPAGDIDRMIARWSAPAVESIPDPAAEQTKAHAAETVKGGTELTTLPPLPPDEAELNQKLIDGISRIIRRRFGIRSFDSTGEVHYDEKQTAIVRFFHALSDQSKTTLNAIRLHKVALALLPQLSTALSPVELTWINEMVVAVGKGRQSVIDWLADHWS